MTTSQKGFAHVELIIVVVVIAVIGLVGFQIYKNGQPETQKQTASSEELSLPDEDAIASDDEVEATIPSDPETAEQAQ